MTSETNNESVSISRYVSGASKVAVFVNVYILFIKVFTGKYTTREMYAHDKTKSDIPASSPVWILISRFLMVVCAISQFVDIQNRKKTHCGKRISILISRV